MIWSPLTMTYTDKKGRVIGKIEEVEKPDPINDEFTVTRYSATFTDIRGQRYGKDCDTWTEAQAMIENLAGVEPKSARNELKQAAE